MSPRRYNRHSRRAAAHETRRSIVRATAALHAEHGALGTTHAMIADRAGVSLPTVYKYFPTRNDLIPHCTGLVLDEAPVKLDASIFGGVPDVPARLKALVKRVFDFYDYASPWLRWSAGDALELPALRAVLDDIAQGRSALVVTALTPGFEQKPPRRLIALTAALLDFPAWRTLTANGLTNRLAAIAAGEALVSLYSATQEEKNP